MLAAKYGCLSESLQAGKIAGAYEGMFLFYNL